MRGLTISYTTGLLLISTESREKAQTSYINVVNVIYAVTAKNTSFMGLGVTKTEVANIIKAIQESTEGGLWKIITDIAAELQKWFDSVHKTAISA